MWIICKNGTAVNTDHVRMITAGSGGIYLDCGTDIHPIATVTGATIEEIVRNILSGEKFMDFREEHDYA